MRFRADHKKITKSLITEFTKQKLKNYSILQDFFLFTDMFQIFKYWFQDSNISFKVQYTPNFQTFKLLNFQTSCNPVKSCKIEIQQHYKIFIEFQFYRILHHYRTFGSPGLY